MNDAPDRDPLVEPARGRFAAHGEELFVALQRLLPQHALSRLLGTFADSKRPWLKNFLIRRAMHRYGIDLSDALLTDPAGYPSFNAFFTRALRPETRPVAPGDDLACAADGAISQCGTITGDRLLQAKGLDYSCAELLGLGETVAERFAGGGYTTIYLAPRDYHRFHMPFSGTLTETLYIPGRLFSVNAATSRLVPNLFGRNERLVCLFETERGLLALVLVGALFVAGIETDWHGRYRAGRIQREHFPEGIVYEKGREIGAFRFGSTVIQLTEQPVTWNPRAAPGASCRMGEALGRLTG